MSLISVKFTVFVFAAALIYFLAPRKYRWCVLLAASMTYYLMICNKYIVYMLVTILTTWIGGLEIGKVFAVQKATVKANKQEWSRAERKQYKEEMLKKARIRMTLVLLLNFGILGFLKYSGFTLDIAEGFLNVFGANVHFPDPGFLLPLGISFYTFQSMGYIIDVYQEKVEPEKNLAKFALFVSFFPQIIQGPIAMYDDLAHQLYEPHDFDLDRLKDGFALILWGVFKKLVIADRSVKLINIVTADSGKFSGTYILFAALLYALQLYADFSGGIDIVRGIGEIFGIQMAENFRRPYFAKSLTEYWHRWHITLGDWVRTYVFYPLSISGRFLKMGKAISGTCGKHLGKVVPTSLASLITFLIIGIWHGANGKYVAFGLWNGGVIMLLEILKPGYEKVFDKLHVNRSGKLFQFLCILWTFFLVLVGYYFDIAKNFSDAMSMLGRSVTDLHLYEMIHIFSRTDEVVAVSSPIFQCGLNRGDYLVILLGGLFLFVISLIQERSQTTVRAWIWKQNAFVQWLILEAGLGAILLLGYYGPHLDPAAFVYMQF